MELFTVFPGKCLTQNPTLLAPERIRKRHRPGLGSSKGRNQNAFLVALHERKSVCWDVAINEVIAAALAALQAADTVVWREPTDVAKGLLAAKVRDIEGNVIGVKQLPLSA